MEQNFVKLRHVDSIPEDFEEHIKFIWQRDVDQVLQAIIDIHNIENDKKIDLDDIVIALCKFYDIQVDDFISDYFDDDDFFETFEVDDLIRSGYTRELLDYVAGDIKDLRDLDDFANTLGCMVGTVGYSPWCYFVAADYVKIDYIQDLFDGQNFYDLIQLDENNDVVDSVGWCYITDDNELELQVYEHFTLDDFWLIDNDAAKYFTHKRAITTHTIKHAKGNETK